MVLEGLQLTLVGMTTVFGFLSLLVGLMVVSSRLLEHYPEEVAPEAPLAGGNEEEIAVVLASIEAHRRARGQN